MPLVITTVLAVAACLFVSGVSWSRGHTAGYRQGRAAGYESGVRRGHTAGLDQAAREARRLAGPGRDLAGQLGDAAERLAGRGALDDMRDPSSP